MSWIVEQSENTSAIHIDENTVTCIKVEPFDDPINVMYNDPADQNQRYYWQIEIQNLDSSSTGDISVGLTTNDGFQDGNDLKALTYSNHLSKSRPFLMQLFGDQSKRQNDKIGLFLQLTDDDLKFYIFHNERPLGLVFHIQNPYPKPLYPVISFHSNAKARITRLEHPPKTFNRSPLQFTGIEGYWKIFEYVEHPECIGVEIEIHEQERSCSTYTIYAKIFNSFYCTLKHNTATQTWMTSPIMVTKLPCPSDEINKERAISDLFSIITNVENLTREQLQISTSNGQKVHLERLIKPNPSPITENIFDE